MWEVILCAFTFVCGAVSAWAFRGLIQRKKDELKAAAEFEAKTLTDKLRGR
jgi:hypothetical protein